MEKQYTPSTRSLWFLMGFLSIGSQVILLRVGMVAFSGNEMIVGPMLFAWTVWIGVGSLLGGRWTGGSDRARMHLLLGAAAVLLPITYFATYLAKVILNVPPAVLVSPVHSFVFFIAALAPLCLILGASFAAGCRLSKEAAGRAVARTYLWDALGAAAGGLMCGGLLLPVLSGAKAVFVLAAVTSAVLAFDSWKSRSSTLPYSAAWAALTVVSITLAIWDGPNRMARDIVWRGYPVIAERDSRYAHLMMVQREGESTLFINGAPALTSPGSPSDETLAYLALTVNPRAKRVLLVGGGLTTVGAKLLDGPIERLDYCQIDPVAIEMEKLISSPVQRDPRVHLHIEDGRRFIRNAKPKSFDLVVLDVGDPDTLAQNRYYTVEFFRQVSQILSNKGVIIFGVGEYANYISNDQASFLLSIKKSLGKVLPSTHFYPLDRFYFTASYFNVPLETPEQIIIRLKELGLNGLYFRSEKLRYDLTKERYKPFYEAINRIGHVSDNVDYRPIGYAYRTNVWLSQFRGGIKNRNDRQFLFKPVFLILLFIILVIIWLLSGKKGRSWSLVPLIFGVGFAGMAVEVAAIYAVQTSFGALYGYIGIIITIYMIGLSYGAAVSCNKSGEIFRRKFILFYFLFTLWIYGADGMSTGSFGIERILLLSIEVFMASWLAGLIFGVAALVGEKTESEPGKLGGLLNFADLIGGALAALALPLLIIPIRGASYAMKITALLLITVGLLGALYIWLKERTEGTHGTKTE